MALFPNSSLCYDSAMNVGRKPVVVLDQECPVITNRVIQEVEKAGMHIMRSFDLDVLRSSSKGFCCPTHGANPCTCHLVILLILRRGFGSLTLILEGIDQTTSVYFEVGIDNTGEEQVDPFLTAALTRAFFPKKYSNQKTYRLNLSEEVNAGRHINKSTLNRFDINGSDSSGPLINSGHQVHGSPHARLDFHLF